MTLVLGGRPREQVLRIVLRVPPILNREQAEWVVDAIEALPPQATDDPVRAAAEKLVAAFPGDPDMEALGAALAASAGEKR